MSFLRVFTGYGILLPAILNSVQNSGAGADCKPPPRKLTVDIQMLSRSRVSISRAENVAFPENDEASRRSARVKIACLNFLLIGLIPDGKREPIVFARKRLKGGSWGYLGFNNTIT